MDIYEIRRRNLWHLIHPRGYSDQGVKRFADRTGKTEQRIRHLVAKSPDDSPVKTIGSKAAREFEDVCNLNSGWLDQEHPENWGITLFRLTRLKELVELYGDVPSLADQIDYDPEYIQLFLDRSLLLDDAAARKIEDRLDLPELWFDVDEQNRYRNVANSEKDEDYITIQQYTDVRAAMGKGAFLLDDEGEVIDLRVSRRWADKKLPANTGINNLKVITGIGDSMKGLYNSGDPLIIDTGVKSVDADGVYFFRLDNEGYVKRLQKTKNGIIVISQNPDYRDWMIDWNDDLEVFGRVVKVWEGKDL